jgi:hypothetical protein
MMKTLPVKDASSQVGYIKCSALMAFSFAQTTFLPLYPWGLLQVKIFTPLLTDLQDM